MTNPGHIACYYCGRPLVCKCQEKDFIIEKIKDVLPLKEYDPSWHLTKGMENEED